MKWEPVVPYEPDTKYIPTDVAGYYVEAYAAFAVKAYRAVVMLTRAAIESTAKLQGITKGSLLEKIDTMTEKRLLRDSTKEVAHEIRQLGNSSAHADLGNAPTEMDADDALKLLGYVLEEVFVIEAHRREVLARRKGSN